MENLWDDAYASALTNELDRRVYTSRLLGRDKTLVLHGGGNTSVKIRATTRFGEPEDILHVKGSGWDLEHIAPAGFAPVALVHARRLAQLERLSDPDMVNELTSHMRRAGAPAPSVETILHACLPYRYVDHTHADAILAITNTDDGEAHVRALFGDRVVVIPYLMPGFDLAQYVAREFPRAAGPHTIGMVLLRHGIFSFGDTARESYQRMIELVGIAESFLRSRGAWDRSAPDIPITPAIAPLELATLRRRIAEVAGRSMILAVRSTERTHAFARHPELTRIALQGPMTPDHVIRTKRIPMIGDDVAGFAERYRAYFAAHAGRGAPKTMLDPAPRVIVDSRFGLATVGRTAGDADIARELYEHTIDTILRAEALGGYRALDPEQIFDVEYWDLEQAKLRRGGTAPAFAGEVALVTGAASGIGKAIVDSFLARGAAVVGLDINPAIALIHTRADYLGIVCDLTDHAAIDGALARGVMRFGGIDMLVLNAGIFGATRGIAELELAHWQQTMRVNLDASFALMRACHPFLKLAPQGGRVVVIGSKNVPAPGPGAAAYSASKAALNQLARVAALEWGADRIRVNTLHPNAVFDTGLWTEDVLAERARRYGLTVEAYKANNVLRTEVKSADVAALAAELCGPLFAKTTGAQIPVDGGNERVI